MGLLRKKVGTEKDEWQTPDWLFDALNAEYDFSLDAAADSKNAKCSRFFDKSVDALKQNWGRKNRAFLNPPHSLMLPFMEKVKQEAKKGTTIVGLVPADVSTQWWHQNVLSGAQMIRFIDGRVDYVGYDLEGNQIKQSPTFASCIVIYDADLIQTVEARESATTVCGLDEPCGEAYELNSDEKTRNFTHPCSCGFVNCYAETCYPIIGETIRRPKRVRTVKNE